jgi:hypothetical protein
MNRIFDLLALVPNTSAVFRAKLAIAGVGAVWAGIAFMASGIEGAILRGGLIAACGALLLGLVSRAPKGKPDEGATPRLRPPLEHLSSCEHDWVDQDKMSNHDPRRLQCTRCGEERLV